MASIDKDKFLENGCKAGSWKRWKNRNSTKYKIRKIEMNRDNVEYECCVASILKHMIDHRLGSEDLTIAAKANKIIKENLSFNDDDNNNAASIGNHGLMNLDFSSLYPVHDLALKTNNHNLLCVDFSKLKNNSVDQNGRVYSKDSIVEGLEKLRQMEMVLNNMRMKDNFEDLLKCMKKEADKI